jgi:hypothetical protein
MIYDRHYAPAENELIYHYCRPDAFLEIVNSRSLWLSASYALNDATERDWGYSIFEKVALSLVQELGQEFISMISLPVLKGRLLSMLMIGSFSLDPDVLSQWRGYADDGRGFAIGFSPKLMQLPAVQLRVLYDENIQTQELTGNLRHVYEVEKAAGFTYGDELHDHLLRMGSDLCAYKNPAFHEEREIRLVHACVVDRQTKNILPLGATRHGKRLSRPLQTRFRMSNGALVPYVVVDYSNKGAVVPVKEIVLGPQNRNAESNIKIFLNSIGLREVTVRRSKAPYRS